jgi:hypothetical protein
MSGGITAGSLAAYASAAAAGLSIVKTLTAKTPQVMQQSPAANATAADTASAQAAAEQKLQQRRAARANSLLSAAGAAGDGTDPLTQAGVAGGKTALGS